MLGHDEEYRARGGNVTYLLAAENVSHQFDIRSGLFRHLFVRAVDDVTFEIPVGETLGLVGESGSGKSTLGRALVRLIKPDKGRICFEGTEVTRLRGRALRGYRRRAQMIFQDPFASLNPRMSVRDIIAEPLRNFGIAASADADRMIREILDMCGLGAAAGSRYPHEFSGGQRQRIGIARALVIRPSFIVCDEPVSALDVSIQAQVVNLLIELRQEFKLTYLFISHDLAIVRYISSRVAVMYLGRIVEIAATERIYRAPAHPYTKVLLSSVPLPDPAAERRRAAIPLLGEIPSSIEPPTGCRFHTRCPWAQFPICRDVDPPLRELAPGHAVACHFADSSYATHS
jgi:oligopeptide transport system ATP-binding protein